MGHGVVGIGTEKPHGVARVVVDDVKTIGPHFFAKFRSIGINVFELGASVFPGRSGSGGEEKQGQKCLLAEVGNPSHGGGGW